MKTEFSQFNRRIAENVLGEEKFKEIFAEQQDPDWNMDKYER